MKKIITTVSAMLFFTALAFSQVTTASDFFKSVSDYYASIKDYEADIKMEIGRNSMEGKVSFKRPEMLRIDFSSPKEQTVVFNGDNLVIYLPGSSAILEQSVKNSPSNVKANQGLGLLKRYYTISYNSESKNEAVPLEEDSDENVIKLTLNRRSSTEAFRVIDLAINPSTKLIRQVIATTAQNEVYKFDITDYKINGGISDQRFVYDPPSSANNYNNFLLSE